MQPKDPVEVEAAPRSPADDAQTIDVVVVGSGAGGMTAALAAHAAGAKVVIIEKASVFGGSTAMSGGGVWVPNAPQFHRLEQVDDPAAVLQYLINIAGDRVAHTRLQRYVEAAPQMMAFLEEQSEHLHDAFTWTRGYSDYYPDKGGNPEGRGLWAKPIDLALLGSMAAELRGGKQSRIRGIPRGVWLTGSDLLQINRIRWRVGGVKPYTTVLRIIGRFLRYWLLRERIVSNGAALATRLRLALRDAGVPVWLSTSLESLDVAADGRVIGLTARADRGRLRRIPARGGVIIASGGFEYNPDMRRRYQPDVGEGWGRGSTDNTGDGIRAGLAVGADVDLMDDAWWFPVLVPSDTESVSGATGGSVAERQYPGQFIVNSMGERFINEAAPYTEFGHVLIEAHRAGVSHIPCWMIIDDRAWRRNIICTHLPGLPMPRHWRMDRGGNVAQADTLEALARRIGVPPEALVRTATRFSDMARRGSDEDYGRGESSYDNYYGDPTYPNPNLAPVDRPPFRALPVFPGDLGTKGGLLTDEDARVLRPDGTVIAGLYACGNASAAVMGNSYAGPGATIGSAMTFGFVAARDITS